jgi:uncharacterized protein YndB with AHSA1/START domain
MDGAKPAPEKAKVEKKIVREMEINAPAEAVWKALTDPKELTKWFPLEARVTPPSAESKEGGKIFLSWGPDCAGEAPIVAWELGRHFAWREATALVDWQIESRGPAGAGHGGKTVVRLVQSGFLGEAEWEEEWFDSTSYGWKFMLLSLRVALERHHGVRRQVAWPRVKTTLTREEAYRRLASAGGIFEKSAEDALRAGQAYALRTASGENWSGTVELLEPLRGFCVSVREMKDALVWMTIEGAPGKIDAQLWLSAYGVKQEIVDAFQKGWREHFQSLFGR